MDSIIIDPMRTGTLCCRKSGNENFAVVGLALVYGALAVTTPFLSAGGANRRRWVPIRPRDGGVNAPSTLAKDDRRIDP